MNINKKNYFTAMYLAAQAGTYFNRVLLVSKITKEIKSNNLREDLFTHLKEIGAKYVQNIRYASSIYDSRHLSPIDLPKVPENYFSWANDFYNNMKGSINANSTEGYLHSLAWQLGNLYCSAAVLSWALLIQNTGAQGSNQETINNTMADIKNNKFAIGAPAMLLGKEFPFIWEAWKESDEALNELLPFAPEEQNDNFAECQQFIDERLLPTIQKTSEKIMQSF